MAATEAAGIKRGRGTTTAKARRARQRLTRGLGAIVVFLLAWQGMVDAKLINPLFASSPIGMFGAFGTLFSGSNGMVPDLKASGLEFLIGFGGGVILAVLLGIVIGWFPFFDDIAEPFISGFYATPYIAFLPVIILWAGIGLTSKVVIIGWATFFPVIINTIAGVKNTPPDFLRVARSFGVSRPRLLRTVVAPAAMPYIMAGLRQGIGRGLVGVIVAEFYIANKGVGFFISSATAAFRTNDAFAAILLLGVAGVVLVRIVAAFEQRLARWRGDTA